MSNNGFELTVVTANLWGLNDWERRARIIAYLLAPHVRHGAGKCFVSLQECNLSSHPNTLVDLSSRLNYTSKHTWYLPGTGVGFFTSGDIQNVEALELPDDKNDPLYFGKRVALIAKVEFDGITVIWVATHLTVNPQKQVSQMRKIIEVIKDQRSGYSSLPVIIAGDLNADPTTDAYKLAVTRHGYRDALATMYAEYPYTWPVNESHYLEREPWYKKSLRRRVDHILVYNALPVEAWTLGRESVEGIYPSDHSIECARMRIASN